jgi:hypothetical protein
MKDDIKKNLNAVEYKDEWIHLAKYSDPWRTLVNTVINIWSRVHGALIKQKSKAVPLHAKVALAGREIIAPTHS